MRKGDSIVAELVLKDVTKKFGSVVAVDNVTLHIPDGKFVALLGPSGCGKTTTLRLIAGLETMNGGRLMIGDRDVTDLPPRQRDIAMVFQDYALFPHMTVFENVGYQLKVRGTEKADLERRVKEVAQLLQIDHLLARRPSQISGGQQQRAAVARALVYQPQVFLFDEPLSNLDAKLRLEARAFLKHLQKRLGVTSIFVTHDQAEAMALADLIAVMDRGKVVQIGTPMEVYQHPDTTFVAGFIGNPPMNLLSCRVDIGEGRIHLATGSLDITALRSQTNNADRLEHANFVGIRAEKIALTGDASPTAIPATLYAVQPLGGEVLISLQVGPELVTARLFMDEPPPLPETPHIALAPEHLHFYDDEGIAIR
jgi:ABC-type sugar transport system ATPase subunit